MPIEAPLTIFPETVANSSPFADSVAPDVDETSPVSTAHQPLAWWETLSFSPWVWGAIFTLNFYFVLPHLPVGREEIQRYFCSHPLEYLQAFLFFVGCSCLILKAVSLRQERRAMRKYKLDELEAPPLGDPVEMAAPIREFAKLAPTEYQDTHWLRRLKAVTAFVTARKTTRGLDEHLKYLHGNGLDRMLDGFGLLQTIIWAVPIVGILGTLVGITVAIGSLAPADSGLTEVTGGLAVAIDTTAVALAESVLLVFAYFFVKRQEETLLGDIEHRSLLDFGRLLTSPAADHPFIQAEAEAAQDLMQRTEVLIKAQTGYWQDSVDHLRLRWQETIADQQQHLAANLAQGVQSTLQDHHGQLVDVRQEFLQTYREVTRKFEETLATAEERRQRQDEQLRANWEEFCQRLGRDLQSAREMHTSEASQLLDGVTRRIDQWQDQLRDATETSQKQLVELTRQGTLLARVVIREEQLAGLQQRLTDNLQAVREAAGFDDTLHSLNAAVHLLTARVRRAA